MELFQHIVEAVGIGARVTLKVVDAVGDLSPPVEPADGKKRAFVPDDDHGFKPERIQFWLEVIGTTLLAVAEGIAEETGKPRGSESDAAEKVEE